MSAKQRIFSTSGGSASSIVINSTTIAGGTTGSVLFVGSGSVIAQDNANFFWDDTNNFLGIGNAVPKTLLHVASQAAGEPRGILSSQHDGSTGGARVHFEKSRGTFTTPTIVVSGDMLGRLRFAGYDGANYLQMGSIDVVSTGTIALTRVPTYMAFLTATDATPSVLTETMRINANGNVGIGITTAPAGRLEIVSAANGYQIVGCDTIADTTAKDVYYGGKHYTNAEEPVFMIGARNDVSNNLLYYGGSATVASLGNAATAHVFYTAANNTTTGGTERMRIDSTGQISMGALTNAGSRLDVQFGGMAVVMGADNGASTRTNTTSKYSQIGSYHYTNAEEPVGVVYVESEAALNNVYFGGGKSSFNAATSLLFYTGANSTTVTGTNRLAIRANGGVTFENTVTAGGTTGNQTIDKSSGTVNFAGGASTLTVTNAQCTATSIIFCSVRTNDTTALIKNVVPGAGSFVITLSAAATAETSVGFLIIN